MNKRALKIQVLKAGMFVFAFLLSVFVGAISADADETTLYAANSEVSYSNYFDEVSDVIPSVPWGREMSSTSGSGYFNLEHVREEDGNGYLYAYQTGNGSRGSRLDLESGMIKGAEVSFDWMPMNCNNKAKGQILFLSNDMWHSYFALGFGSDYKLYAYTENAVEEASTVQAAFDGSVSAGQPIEIGFGAKDTWYTVNLKFDYLAHTMDLTICQRDGLGDTFTQNAIPIETEANGIRSMVIHMQKLRSGASVAMGLDNLQVSYEKFASYDLVEVINPDDVALSKKMLEDFTFPKNVVAYLGDGSRVRVRVGEWTSTPAFDGNVSGEYIWTAEVMPGNYTSYLLSDTVSFKMTYMVLDYPVYVYSPPTLELEYGESFDKEQFPTTVIAHMGDGVIANVNVGEWTAIREFDAEEEGIYVYGANIVPLEDVYEINRDLLKPNENPDDPSEQRVDYIYDVYYRVSYFKTEDNYNAYTRSMEYLDRGVYAVETEDGVFVSWRLLVTEYGEDIAFNVYRNGVLVNESPIDSKTNFVDAEGKAGDVYVVEKLQDGLYYASEEAVAGDRNYLSIPVQNPGQLPNRDGELAGYTINDAGCADVDGDGQYEIIIKWYPDNQFDSGSGNLSSPTILDIYEMDGTALWRLNLGLEIPSGAHFTQFMLYDLDEDGRAELFVRTSDGAISYKPNAEGKFDMNDESTIVSYVGDRLVVPGSNVNDNGHVANTTNEYVSVFDGMTGEEIDTIDYINTTGEYVDWGKDDAGNRSARYNIAIAYLPKEQGDLECTETIPAVLLQRGYYAKTTVAAYTLRDGKLNLEWNFVAPTGDLYAGKGNHNVATGDLDKDGFDELVIGAMALDHDGTVLWAKTGTEGQDYAGHGDAIHLAAMNSENNDLYVFSPQEACDILTLNYSLTNAGTGGRYLGSWFYDNDSGRAVAANITPDPGYEVWAAVSGAGIYGFDGSVISKERNLPHNWVLYWDGDLFSELGDGDARIEGNAQISKYNEVTESCDILATFEGTAMCNYTKNTPSLTADLLGDWREEVVVRSADNTELRIYMTTTQTDYMIYTLMHDPVYRNAVANQNSGYNQPPHVGFYLGEDNREIVLNRELITAAVEYTRDVEEEGSEVPGEFQDPDAPLVEPDDYYVVADATGDVTTINCTSLVRSEFIAGYQVTTVKEGRIVKQEIVKKLPESVDTTGAGKVEVVPVFFYDIGVAGEKGTAGYDIMLPACSYDFTIYNTGNNRCDVYADDQILVNNFCQGGFTPNFVEVKDIVCADDVTTISTQDYSGSGTAADIYLRIQMIPSSSIAERARKVYVLGDSSVCMYYNGANAVNNAITGWGQVLADYLVDEVDVINLANSGITAEWLLETAFTQVRASAKPGDILLLQSGNNDRAYSTREKMTEALTTMVTEAKALGVEVILIAPNASAKSYKENVAWTDVMAAVGEATKTTYMDLAAASYAAMYELYGLDTTVVKIDWYVSDATHSSFKGANKWASLIAGFMYENGFEEAVDTEYVFAFVDAVGNVISCNSVGKMAEGYAKVTFSMNGKDGIDTYQILTVGSKALRPTKPITAGYTFEGWYKDAECTDEWDFETDVVNEDTTIYAKWLENPAGVLYTENFNNLTADDLTAMVTAQNTDALKLGTGEDFGQYLSYDFSTIKTNSRGLDMTFGGLDVSVMDAYVIEFDASITPGNNQTTCFTLKSSDFKYIGNNVNYGTESGYLLNLEASGGSSTYTMNESRSVTIPGGERCHYVIYVDKAIGLVSITINGSESGTIVERSVTGYSGNGNLTGLYVLAGRYNPVINVDNLLVREVGQDDVFDEIPDEGVSVAAFVERMYTVALGREAEGEGAAWWTTELLAGNSDGAGLAQGFLTGNEFKSREYTNAEFVGVLYATFFDREIAEGEGDFWIGALDVGEPRESVLAGFVNSEEFFALCAEYGISRGTMLETGIAVNAGIGKFTEHLYTEVLGREGEESGMEYWAISISKGDCTPKDVAMNFFTSDEYVAKNTGNDEYLEALYRTFMGRESDAEGLNFWLNSMNAGTDTRESALNSFAASAEFRAIMDSYGL